MFLRRIDVNLWEKKLTNIFVEFIILQKQPTGAFCKIYFPIFTENHLCWSLFAGLQFCNFIKKRLQHQCFLVNTAKFLTTPILKRTTASYFMKKNRHSWRLNNSSKKVLGQWKSVGFQFCKLTSLQRKIQRKCMQI